MRAILWLPTWQGLDGLQKSLHLCALDESSLTIGRVNHCTCSWSTFLSQCCDQLLMIVAENTPLLAYS